MSALRDLMPPHWADALNAGPVNIGLDVGSTVKKTSNPSSITVMEHDGGIYWQRLVVRFKTTELDVIVGCLRYILDCVPERQRGTLLIDSSNEKFAYRLIRRALSGLIRCKGYSGQNTVTYLGEKSDAKTAMGAAYLTALEDGIMAMPPAKWIEKDHRLVTRNGSRFSADVDAAGNHADTFDSGKLAFWGFVEKGLQSGGWKPAATSFYSARTNNGETVMDRQRGRLNLLRRKARNRIYRKYLSM